MENNKTYEFIGKIIEKEKTKVYNRKSPHFNKPYYRLQVELENKSDLKEILVFQGSKVWKNIEEAQYIDNRYLFYCSPKVSNYRIVSYQLVDWQEIKNHGNN